MLLNAWFNYDYKIFMLPFLRTIVAAFGSHLNVDLQQRAVEFGALCRSHDHLRGPLLERMPPIPGERETRKTVENGGNDQEQDELGDLLLGDMPGETSGSVIESRGNDSVS